MHGCRPFSAFGDEVCELFLEVTGRGFPHSQSEMSFLSVEMGDFDRTGFVVQFDQVADASRGVQFGGSVFRPTPMSKVV